MAYTANSSSSSSAAVANVSAGLATNFVLEDEVEGTPGCDIALGTDKGESKYYVKVLKGGISTSTANASAGALFANVYVSGNKTSPEDSDESVYKINVDGYGIDLSGIKDKAVTGNIAGGLFGKVSGDICINVLGYPTVMTTVYSNSTAADGCAGAFIGKAENGAKIKFSNTKSINFLTNVLSSNTSNTGAYVGGVIGYLNESVLECSGQGEILRSGSTRARYRAGGFVGYALNSSVTVTNFTLDKNTYVYEYAGGHYTAGGVIGMYDINASNIGADKLDISYIKTTNKDGNVSSNIKITTANNANCKAGGIAGVINSGDAVVNIHDINTDAVPDAASKDNCYYVSMVYRENNGTNTNYLSVNGGIAGEIGGENVTINNVVIDYVLISASRDTSNSIAGNVIGNLVGRVGYVNGVVKPSKMVVSNINVVHDYINRLYGSSRYFGGLFGYVNSSVIALRGNINMANVPYKTIANDSTDSYTGYVMFGGLRQRGVIAGYSVASVIYEDAGCTYTRPLTYNEEDEKYYDAAGNEYDPGIIAYSSYNTANDGSRYKYNIDDIGNATSILKNVLSEDGSTYVIDITKSYDKVFTGSIEKNSDGKYVIDSLADALRLAAAGNSVNSDGKPQFAGNCFVGENEEIPTLQNDILTYHYLITCDLNLKDAGIHGFVNNENIKYSFTGTFEGVLDEETNKYPLITMYFLSRQKYGGLFPYAQNATFKNFDVDGIIAYTGGTDNSSVSSYNVRAGAGSLAAYATDQITIDNVNVYTLIKASNNSYTIWDNSHMFCYGGYFGLYYPNGKSYSINNSIIATKFRDIRSNSFVGGMIGWIRVASGGILNSMSVDDCTLSVDITTDELYQYNCGGNGVHAREAGFIGLISTDYYNVGSTNSTWVMPATLNTDATYANIEINNMSVKDAKIDLTTVSNTNSNANARITGGFLGYSWQYVDVDVNGLTIENSTIMSRGVTGGLVSFAAGIFDFTGVTIKSLDMTDVKSASYYSGFLVGNGQNAVVNIKDYALNTDEGQGTINVAGYVTFDELVGNSVRFKNDVSGNTEYNNIFSTNRTVDNSYSTGGIVNYIEPGFGTFVDGEYKSYTNKIITTKNKYTRYYYNLFQNDSVIDVVSSEGQISSPEQWLTFSAANYASQYVKRFFNDYYNGGTFARIRKYKVNCDLDMAGYSIYPTPLTVETTVDFNNHALTLYADTVYDLENKLYTDDKTKYFRSNEGDNGSATQHYMLHCAVFNQVTAKSVISNLTLKGVAGNIGSSGKDSGALIAGGMTGAGHVIEGISLDNLRIHNYNDTKCGLLIAHIGTNGLGNDLNTSVTIKDIETINYGDSQTAVAAALIGYAGSDDADNVKIYFSELRLEDEKVTGTSYGKLFKYASLIYDYEYTTDLEKNRCYVLYTFTKAQCDAGDVTFGDEIKAGVHYSDVDRDIADPADKLNIAIQEAIDGKYIPYIFQLRNIYVNPRNGNLEKGCGTYEDPYIIESSKQLLTLYLYLTGKTEYETTFKGTGSDADGEIWKVVPVGGSDGDKSACSGEETHVSVAYGDTKFPTRDDLRVAYYKLANDIALDNCNDMNDQYISEEFCGLGTELYPFAGVIIGTKDEGTGNYTITLPKQGKRTKIVNNVVKTYQLEQSSFGFIQYMGGAVIKDVNIVGRDYLNAAYYNAIEYGGGVAAKIVGGDNIIDNVKVMINFNTNPTNKTDHMRLGGLVGIIENGSLILRNMDGNKSSQACTFADFTTASVISGMAESIVEANLNETGEVYTPYSYATGDFGEVAGMFVGKVEDGYVIYEGYTSAGDEPVFLDNAQMGLDSICTSAYPLVNGFRMLNKNYLDGGNTGYKIAFTKTDDNTDPQNIKHNYNAIIKNAIQLELFTIALNSDSLSVYYCQNNDHSTGYGYKNICRKAEYSHVGKADALGSDDRRIAVSYDDNRKDYVGYLYPYICYNYIDYTALSPAGQTGLNDADFETNNYAGYLTTLTDISSEQLISDKSKTALTICGNINKTADAVENYTTSYELCRDDDNNTVNYDMTPFDLSFKGIGGISTYAYSDFRANFDGKDNSVTFIVNRKYDDTVMFSGFFNQLSYNERMFNVDAEQFEIKNLILKNSIVHNPNEFSEIAITNATEGSNYINAYGVNTCATGSLAGIVRGAWKFENITLNRTEQITYSDITSDVSGYTSVGGLVGRINNTDYSSAWPTDDWLSVNTPKSNDIDFVNCKAEGSDTNKIKVTELGSTNYYIKHNYYAYRYVSVGGLVGGIGTNVIKGSADRVQLFGEIDFNGCSLKNMSVEVLNKGHIGGVAGMVGIRYRTYDDRWAGYGSCGNVTFDGSVVEDLGNGTVNVVKTDSSIENLSVTSGSNAEDYSAGGIFGRIENVIVNSYGGNTTVTNYKMKNIAVDNTRAVKLTTRIYTEAAGGILGYYRGTNVNISNLVMNGTNYIGSENAGKDIGGLIGYIRPTGGNNTNYSEYKKTMYVNITNCNLSGLRIKSNTGNVGGFVGLLMGNNINIGNEDSYNIISNSEISTTTAVDNTAAGGVAGWLTDIVNILGTTFTANIVNTKVVDTSITGGKYSGGIIGRLERTANTTKAYCTVKNAYIYSTDSNAPDISALYSAGGIAGLHYRTSGNSNLTNIEFKLDGDIAVGTCRDEDSKWSSSKDTGINISAEYTGAIMGFQHTTYAETHPAEIVVANNRIYSYVNNTSAQPNTYSGGLYGYIRHNGTTSGVMEQKYNKVTVKNNVIMTGGNTAVRNKKNLGAGAGGIFGVLWTKDNNRVQVYMPEVTLTDNSIGYFVADDSITDWRDVTVTNSDNVKLLSANVSGNVPSYVSWKTEDINDDNISQYALGFGTFIGYYYGDKDTYHVYVLDPKVSYTNGPDSVGSMPVVEVGSNAFVDGSNTSEYQSGYKYQAGYPYVYRKNCHFVYMTDTTGTIYDNISKSYYDTAVSLGYADYSTRKPLYMEDSLLSTDQYKYRFGQFEGIIRSYRNLNDGIMDQAQKNYNYLTAGRYDAYFEYNQTVANICKENGTYENYFDLTFDVRDENGNLGENIINGVPVLVLDGLKPQIVGDYAAAVLTNGGSMIPETMITTMNNTYNSTNSPLNGFWSVQCKNAYIDADGTIKEITSSSGQVYTEHKKASITIKDKNRINATDSIYDQKIILTDGGTERTVYTISLLEYTYVCKGAVTDKTETIYIPIFMKEKVTMDTYIRILSGEEYSLSTAQTAGYKDNVTISHDSTYTIYAEFVYDAIRNNKNFLNDTVEKTLCYNANVKVIHEGTKFTLIDYQTGIAYYYTAVAGQENEIPFSSFEDKDGNPYVQRNISSGIASELSFNSYKSIGYIKDKVLYSGANTYTDIYNKKGIGVERFFIVVEPPEAQTKAQIDITVSTSALDGNGMAVDEFFNKNKKGDSVISAYCIPGPTIGFGGIGERYSEEEGGDYYTYIAGKISQESVVDIDANIEIKLKDVLSDYWEDKIAGNTIDSTNTDKYLEVAVTLIDEDNNVVPWPAGTNMRINDGSMQLLRNSLVVYAYKDIDKEFAMNSVDKNIEDRCFYYNVNESKNNRDYRWVRKDDEGKYFYYSGYDATEGRMIETYLEGDTLKDEFIDISNQLHITFDFSVADIENYNGKNYTIMIKLYRSDSPEYPNEGTTKSYGNTTVRQYSDTVAGESKRALAGAISANDLMDLGINLYNNKSTEFEIPFTNKLDFTDLIHTSKVDEDVDELKDKTYGATYRIYKKVPKNPDTGENRDIDYNENIGSVISNSSEYEYQIIEWDESPFELYDADGNKLTSEDVVVNTDEKQNVINTVSTFTAEEIKDGIEDAEGNKVAYVTNWGNTLKVNQNYTTAEGNKNITDEELTNYMVTVTYTPSGAADDEIIYDYFIFTIAKLKTDL